MVQELLLWIDDILVCLGIIIMTIAIYGMVWMPTLYTRLHAATKAVFLGIIPILLTLFRTGEPSFIYRAILIGVFLMLTTPVSAHVIAWAAYVKREPMGPLETVDESGKLRRAAEQEQTRA